MSFTVLCSTGVVTRAPDKTDYREILEHGPALGARALELLVHQEWYSHLDEVIDELRNSKLSFPVAHAAKELAAGLGAEEANKADEALGQLEDNCRLASALGGETLVLHLWEQPTGDQELERNLDRLPACLDVAEASNLVVAVETITGTAGTALANVRLAVERDDRCRVTLDTEFLGFHGELEESLAAGWLWADDRVRHVHLKDFDGRMRDADGPRYLFVGEGNLDLDGFLAGLRERGYEGAVTFEGSARRPSGELDPARLQKAAGIVRELSGS